MTREALDSLDKEALIRRVLAQAETIAALTRQVETLTARLSRLEADNVALRTENAALREKLKLPPKTPDNSSTPPSQGKKPSADLAAASGSRGPRKSHPGTHRPLHPDPTRRRDILADHCRHCGTDVSGVTQTPFHAYDHIELPAITPDVTRVTLHRGGCPCCGRPFRAEAPADMPPGSPFGPNLRAFVIYLRFVHAISFERLSQLMSDLFGLAISEGALVAMLADSRPAFARERSLIRARLLAGSVLQSDETSVRVGKRNWWLWTFHHGQDCCFVIRPSRGKDVVAEFLGDVRPAFWVSDRFGAQMGWATTDHQVCLAHLLRDAQYAIEAGDIAFAPGLQELLQRACAIGRRRPALADATLRAYRYKLDADLDALLHIIPTHTAGEKLKEAIAGCRRSLFVFLADRAVPPTNNGSEQALRPCVVFRKVTNCFRSEWGAHLYADIRSVIETARRRAIGILDAIRKTLNGSPLINIRRTATITLSS
jgi:transposase